MIANIAAWDGLSLNGTAPVNAFAQMNDGPPPVGYLQRTSIVTIANEKTSASLL